jgi:hypothetical protein
MSDKNLLRAIDELGKLIGFKYICVDVWIWNNTSKVMGNH